MSAGHKKFKSLRQLRTNRPPSRLLDTSGREINESSCFSAACESAGCVPQAGLSLVTAHARALAPGKDKAYDVRVVHCRRYNLSFRSPPFLLLRQAPELSDFLAAHAVAHSSRLAFHRESWDFPAHCGNRAALFGSAQPASQQSQTSHAVAASSAESFVPWSFAGNLPLTRISQANPTNLVTGMAKFAG